MIIRYKGLPVHYTAEGQGLPIVFLHGFNESTLIWDFIRPQLLEHYQLITIDLPGFGKSPLPNNLSISYMADSVYRLLDELNLYKPILIGHSMGGYVGLELYHKHPNSLSAAGLFHSTSFEDSSDKKENRKKTITFLENNPLESFLDIFTQGLFAEFNRKLPEFNMVKKLVFENSKESVIAATKAMMERADRAQTLKDSKIPWLFIAGNYDELIPAEQISLQASFCKMSLFKLLKHSGHLGMVEEPQQSAEIIHEFIKWVQLYPNNELKGVEPTN